MDPVALLTLAGHRYQVASHPKDGRYHFRAEGESAWTALDSSQKDGWTRVATEVVCATTDVLCGYLTTHAMTVRDRADVAEGVQEYQILDLTWQMRRGEDDTLDVQLGEGRWQTVQLAGAGRMEDKPAAIRGLIAADPGVAERFAQEARNWAGRIAAGCTVMPAFSF